MRPQLLANCLSLAVHGLLVAGFFGIAVDGSRPHRPLKIDFTLELQKVVPGPAVMAPQAAAVPEQETDAPALMQEASPPQPVRPAEPVTAAVAPPVKKMVAQRQKKKMAVPKDNPVPEPLVAAVPVSTRQVEEKERPEVSEETRPAPESVPSPRVEATTIRDIAGGGVEAPSSSPAVVAGRQGESSGGRPVRGEVASTASATAGRSELYLRRHFAGIKNTIQGSIGYPRIARRMGWQGRVVLSFVVCMDGTVTDVRVVESSGYPALDSNAAATIKKVSPFPRPPMRAELVVPIVYRLG